ncbi:uncharacterized protein JNUCC1_00560 [Lentibacillus sp. JNUCC-1]|uniref:5-oxoprolinase subunit PxpB n=1 Tax=Lentibacillus sp. JNUCC-1 TaxID=2654513 RepID=UPI0012E931E0|nr:5-oxoprolinase subunit PxpB [Lentibacillus sp. JNUCC-1]MUV36756.1 uncharacterized protein [Lentibacillus sp. JNUCC-1]
MTYELKIAGDQAILIEFSGAISLSLNQKVRHLSYQLETSDIRGIGETIIGYKTVLIHYDPLLISFDRLQETVEYYVYQLDESMQEEPRTIEIPVLYGGEQGPDLETVANKNKLTAEQVIEIHTAPLYTVYFLGFSPGFPFLGGMSDQIATPRLAEPRAKIQAGSVGIAHDQTGIYPVESPGGWQIIGHTPLRLYAPEEKEPFLLNPGDQIKFKAVDQQEYETITTEQKSPDIESYKG